jgi:hypothetical protein
VPIVAGSGHTSPLGPFRPAHGETSIRLVTMGHLLGRHQSLGTRPALDGRSAGRSPTLPGRGRAVKRLSERTSAGRGTSPPLQDPDPVTLRLGGVAGGVGGLDDVGERPSQPVSRRRPPRPGLAGGTRGRRGSGPGNAKAPDPQARGLTRNSPPSTPGPRGPRSWPRR